MITRQELNSLDIKELTLSQARKLIIQMRDDILELFRERHYSMLTANKFSDQYCIAANFICQQRDKIDEETFTIKDFLLESDKVLRDLYIRGLEDTTFIKRSGTIRHLGRRKI